MALERLLKGGIPGLVVMGGDFCSKGFGFKFQHCILDGHFFTFISCKNCNGVSLKRPKINNKRGRGGPIFKYKPLKCHTSNNLKLLVLSSDCLTYYTKAVPYLQ